MAARTGFNHLVKVNLGCGATPTPGWVNLDNSWTIRLSRWPAAVRLLSRVGMLGKDQLELARVAFQHRIRWANAAQRIPLSDCSAAAVYSSHMLEHLDRGEARQFLAEAFRVLAPGGVVRIAVPDLRRLARSYIEGSLDADQFVAATLLAADKPKGLLPAIKLTAIGPRHHHWMFDAASLMRLLEAAGFEHAVESPPGSTTISDPGELDLRERESESVYVEARRPV